ncbi:MAG: zeta toxin family protein [Pseudolabrys sp.]|nr:zeta toxin family protein [Pseudolabrys sp.]
MSAKPPVTAYSAWNPGLESQPPREYLPLSTMFRPENVSTSIAKAHELSDYCGLPVYDLVAFRVERLIVHELLIRVAAGIAVPDGTKYVDLGTNFRQIASTILNRYIAPHRSELSQIFDDMMRAASATIAQELSKALAPAPQHNPKPPPDADKRWRWPSIFGTSKTQPALPHRPDQAAEARAQEIVSQWRARSEHAESRREEACLSALVRVATAIIGKRGRLFADPAIIAEIATTLVGNDYGSEIIGNAIEPYFQDAVAREGFKRLPAQTKPVVMNVKGASAAGKSTMRPLQRILAKKLNFPWDEFALISPDIFRKFLLDYESLGEAYKYAGTMTGHEVEIIDKKLDRYMAARAARGEMSHLLIDRFRFDSFAPVADGIGTSKLLTRFGDLVYMFFVITPPEMTVERAWTRGLKVGRYKAVEDLLAHNVEAFTGMPELFFTWARIAGKRVHYEFLDNSVPEGQPPRTVAFGWNGEMTILDIKSMIDIDRFRKINIHAHKPDEVYTGDNFAPECNVDFLKRCARLIPTIKFADDETGRVYALLQDGKWTWRDEKRFAEALQDPQAKAGLEAISPDDSASPGGPAAGQLNIAPTNIAVEKAHTLGAWGEAASKTPGR